MSEMGKEMTKWLLRQSMGEELTTSSAYQVRALQAEENGDWKTGDVYLHIAKEEDKHYNSLKERLIELGMTFPVP